MPLVVGALLALAGLVWVMMPLFTRTSAWLADRNAAEGADEASGGAETERRELELDVRSGRLDRVEFERLTGGSPPDATAAHDR